MTHICVIGCKGLICCPLQWGSSTVHVHRWTYFDSKVPSARSLCNHRSIWLHRSLFSTLPNFPTTLPLLLPSIPHFPASTVQAFQGHLEVSNYPLKTRSPAKLKELEAVQTLRRIELADRKVSHLIVTVWDGKQIYWEYLSCNFCEILKNILGCLRNLMREKLYDNCEIISSENFPAYSTWDEYEISERYTRITV